MSERKEEKERGRKSKDGKKGDYEGGKRRRQRGGREVNGNGDKWEGRWYRKQKRGRGRTEGIREKEGGKER